MKAIRILLKATQIRAASIAANLFFVRCAFSAGEIRRRGEVLGSL